MTATETQVMDIIISIFTEPGVGWLELVVREASLELVVVIEVLVYGVFGILEDSVWVVVVKAFLVVLLVVVVMVTGMLVVVLTSLGMKLKWLM